MPETFTLGGIHPAENKITAGKQIINLPIPPVVTIPVLQHIGTPAKAIVKKGERVKTGQLIANGEGFISANIHASVTGIVSKVEKLIDSSGYKRMAIEIETTPDEWMEQIDHDLKLVSDISLTIPEIMVRIWESGIVGLGGATFPSHVKMTFPRGKKVELLIINGVECEPYLTADHALMLEKGEEILVGIRIVMTALGVKQAFIGIEINKADAIEYLQKISGKYPGILIRELKVKYPQGSEKQLIKALTGREIPSGGLPVDVGTVVFNVSTMFAVYEAVQKNKPLIDRVVTVTGKSLKNPGNFRTRIGTHVSELIRAAGGLPENAGKIIGGGPMMGKALNSLDVPVIKGTSGLLVLDDQESRRRPVMNCIRCARCISVCPVGLEPYPVSYTHLRAHETRHDLVCRLLLEKKKYWCPCYYCNCNACLCCL